MAKKMKLGRVLNPLTMMWEVRDGSGVAVPEELMPRPGDFLFEWIYTKKRLARAAATANGMNEA